MAIDKKLFAQSSTTQPAGEASEVSPADADLPSEQYSRALYVGGEGNLVVAMAGLENIVTFANVPAGTLLPIRVSQVRAATTATAIVALY